MKEVSVSSNAAERRLLDAATTSASNNLEKTKAVLWSKIEQRRKEEIGRQL